MNTFTQGFLLSFLFPLSSRLLALSSHSSNCTPLPLLPSAMPSDTTLPSDLQQCTLPIFEGILKDQEEKIRKERRTHFPPSFPSLSPSPLYPLPSLQAPPKSLFSSIFSRPYLPFPYLSRSFYQTQHESDCQVLRTQIYRIVLRKRCLLLCSFPFLLFALALSFLLFPSSVSLYRPLPPFLSCLSPLLVFPPLCLTSVPLLSALSLSLTQAAIVLLSF